MITLDVESYCQDCDDFSPIVSRLYADGTIFQQIVTCENIRGCRGICKYIRESIERENKEEKNNETGDY